MKNKAFTKETERAHREEILTNVRENLENDSLGRILEEYHSKNISEILFDLSPSERSRLLSAIGKEAMANILSYLDNTDEYLSSLSPIECAAIVESMDADDAATVLARMNEHSRQSILELIGNNEIKNEIGLLGSYGEDRFGSRMSTDFICFQHDLSVKEAMKDLISKAPESDNIYTLFTVSADGSFYGAIALKDLISARSGDSLDKIICTDFPYVYDNDIISESIGEVRRYLEDLIPVLSSEDKSIIGVITSADITDMVDEELGDDYAKLAALSEKEKKNESLIKSMKKRVPWLIVLLFLGLTVSSVVGLFESVVNELPLIVAFQSLILGMAGNVGTQSLAVTVRVLGNEHSGKSEKYFATIIRETRVALINGSVIGGVAFLTVGAYLFISGSCAADLALSVSACVGISMCASMMISGFTGASVPICLHLIGADPAIASGPLITTINDLAAVISYYGLAWALLLNFV